MKDFRYRDSKWLTKKYSIEGLSERVIARICKVSHRTIGRSLKKHNIRRRTYSEAALFRSDYPCKPHIANKTYRNIGWLEKKAIKEELTSGQIAKQCGVSQNTILDWFKKFGIPKGRNLEDKMINTSVCFPKTMYAKLIEYCRRRGVSRSGMIRELVLEGMIRNGFNPYK